MIIVKTKLKKIPERCTKCGYSEMKYISEYDLGYCNAAGFITLEDTGRNVRYCTITGSDVPYVYDKEKKHRVYTKCSNCPLMEI